MDNKIEWQDKGMYLTAKVRGGTMLCVSCRKPLEHSKVTHRNMHKCSVAHENRREASNRAAYDTVPTRRDMTYGQRLSLGFSMIGGGNE